MRKLAPKRRGELAEIRFLLAAASKGLLVAKPWGDSEPFDFLVGRDGRYLRVQVKSTSSYRKSRYVVNCYHTSRHKGYTGRDIDIVAVYIVPEDKWYIIPVQALGNSVQISFSNLPTAKRRFEPFLDAWHYILGQ
jgi:hypothetical protein